MGQSIKDVMASDPCTIDAGKSVAYAAKMMRDEDVGVAPIVEGDKLIGVLTDRDIATRVVAEGKDPEQTTVRMAVTAAAGGRELSQRLAKIETAIFRRKTIVFDYYTIGRDKQESRKVKPYHLLFRGGQFYLIGF